MAAEMTVGRTHDEFTGKASSSESQSATHRAASDTLEGLSQTQSHQVTQVIQDPRNRRYTLAMSK